MGYRLDRIDQRRGEWVAPPKTVIRGIVIADRFPLWRSASGLGSLCQRLGLAHWYVLPAHPAVQLVQELKRLFQV